MKPLTQSNPELNVKVSLAEIDRLVKQARSHWEQSPNPADNKHLKFLDTVDHFLHKDRERLFLTESQLKYLCDLAKVSADRYVYIDIM